MERVAAVENRQKVAGGVTNSLGLTRGTETLWITVDGDDVSRFEPLPDRVADINSPILKDWAKAQMQKTNEAVLRGRTPFVATSLCWPGGVSKRCTGWRCGCFPMSTP